MLQILQKNLVGPLSWTPPHLQSPFSHKPFGTRAGFEFIFPRGRTAIYPFPFTRAEASLIGHRICLPVAQNDAIFFHESAWPLYTCVSAARSAHEIAPT